MQWTGMEGLPSRWAAGIAAALALALTSCANPGSPQPPSLHLPALVRGVTAERVGDAVTLHFTVSQRTTDNLPVRGQQLGLTVCREVEHAGCVPMGGTPAQLAVKGAGGTPNGVTLTDHLPVALTLGTQRLLGYRVELRNAAGRSAGFSEAGYTTAGQAPAMVQGLSARGSRLGVVLAWGPAGEDTGTLYIRRRDTSDRNAKGTTGVLLRFDPASGASGERLLDTSAAEDVPYLYSGYREQRLTVGGRALVVRSDESAPVEFTLRDVFPPPAPTDVTAAPLSGESGAYSVDLIWQPVDDPELAGYNVYREALGEPAGPRQKLTSTPVAQPAFHDATAQVGTGYRWTVTAVDHKGNESAGATVVLEPARQ